VTAGVLRGVPMVETTRGNRVESVHEIVACAVGRDGEVCFALGSIDVPVFLRSAAKPMISAVSVMAGVPALFGLTQEELAVMTASHAGEPYHIAAVRSILEKIGLDERALQCGSDYPYDYASAEALIAQGIPKSPIYHNCSGKHAGILALCKAIGADPATYMEPENAAQQRILAFCAKMSGMERDGLIVAVDGCGIPVFAAPLENSARAYMRIATLEGLDDDAAYALQRVRDAMIAFPEQMSGTGEFDAALIRAGNGVLICKGGAEGVHATALFDIGVGIVIKVVDGAERARPAAALASLAAIGGIGERQAELLRSFANPPVRNRAGRVVGEIRVCQAVFR